MSDVMFREKIIISALKDLDESQAEAAPTTEHNVTGETEPRETQVQPISD